MWWLPAGAACGMMHARDRVHGDKLRDKPPHEARVEMAPCMHTRGLAAPSDAVARCDNQAGTPYTPQSPVQKAAHTKRKTKGTPSPPHGKSHCPRQGWKAPQHTQALLQLQD